MDLWLSPLKYFFYYNNRTTVSEFCFPTNFLLELTNTVMWCICNNYKVEAMFWMDGCISVMPVTYLLLSLGRVWHFFLLQCWEFQNYWPRVVWELRGYHIQLSTLCRNSSFECVSKILNCKSYKKYILHHNQHTHTHIELLRIKWQEMAEGKSSLKPIRFLHLKFTYHCGPQNMTMGPKALTPSYRNILKNKPKISDEPINGREWQL